MSAPVPTDLQRVTDYAIAVAAGLEGRAAATKKLARLLGTELDVSVGTEQVERIAELIRSYADITGSITRTLAAQTSRAEAAEAALSQGMALVEAIKACSLDELTAFWRRQQEKQQ